MAIIYRENWLAVNQNNLNDKQESELPILLRQSLIASSNEKSSCWYDWVQYRDDRWLNARKKDTQITLLKTICNTCDLDYSPEEEPYLIKIQS